jgi:alkylation response protein AidB-like acyl-CoA dehydrogenase
MTDWGGTGTGGDLLASIADVADELRASVTDFDTARRLPDRAVDLLRSTGVFRMTLPLDLGGAEADPLTQIRAVELLAELDASLGWYAMIGSDGGYYSSFLEEAAAKRLYGLDPDVITAGFVEPAGRAEITDGGYLVGGRWPFGSASMHSTWLASGCRVRTPDADDPANGRWVVALLPRQSCEVLEDSWQTLGLRGSGSFDYRAEDVFVPADQVFSFVDGPRRTSPLYRFPLMYRANTSGVALGVARGAITEFRRAVAGKTDVATGKAASQSHHVQQALGRAEALLGAARSYAYATVGELWDVLCDGGEPNEELRVRFRLMLAHVNQSCRDAVGQLFTATGGSAIYTRNPIERRFRDVNTLSQHALAHDRTFELAGKALLGLPLSEPMFC